MEYAALALVTEDGDNDLGVQNAAENSTFKEGRPSPVNACHPSC